MESNAEPGPSNPSGLFFCPQEKGRRQTVNINLHDEMLSKFNLRRAFDIEVIQHNNTQLQLRGDSRRSGADGLPDDPALVKKRRKQEKESFKSLFRNIPGKIDTKKDHYFMELTMLPPEKEVEVKPLDDERAAVFVFTEMAQLPPESVADEDGKKKKKKRKREHDSTHHLAIPAGDPSSSSHSHHHHQQPIHRNSAAPTPAAHLPTPGGAPPVLNATKRGIVRKERDEPPGSASGIPPSKKRRQEGYPIQQQPTPQGP